MIAPTKELRDNLVKDLERQVVIIQAILRFIFGRATNAIASQRILPRRVQRKGREVQLAGTRQEWLGYILAFLAFYLALVFFMATINHISDGKHNLAVFIVNLALGLSFAALSFFAWRYLTSVAYWEDDESLTKTTIFGKEQTIKYADITAWTMVNRRNSYYIRVKTGDGRWVIVSYTIYRIPLLLRALIEREAAGDFEEHPLKRESRIARLVAEFDIQILNLQREREKTGRDVLSEYSWYDEKRYAPAAHYEVYGMTSQGKVEPKKVSEK